MSIGLKKKNRMIMNWGTMILVKLEGKEYVQGI